MVGKTHVAVGLARKAAQAGYRTYFTTAADLAARCHRAAIEGRWATTMRFFAGPTQLVINELGYLPLPADAAAALFQVISTWHLKTSTVLTTNRGIASWGSLLGDDMNPAPDSNEASCSNDPTRQEVISKSRDTPIQSGGRGESPPPPPPGSHRTVRDSLPSHGSYHPVGRKSRVQAHWAKPPG